MSNNKYRNIAEKNTDELFKRALEIWERNSQLDIDDENNPFYKIEQDPVVRLLIAALSYQENQIKREIHSLKDNIIEDFINQTIPSNLIKSIPSSSIIQTAKLKNMEQECFADEETPFIIDVPQETGKTKKMENFCFIPLLRTKIVNAHIDNINYLENNRWGVGLIFDDPIKDLSGMSFYFPNKKISNLKLLINNNSVSVISPEDYDKLPFTKWFNVNNMLFEKALTFGTTESWYDIFAARNFSLYYVDSYPMEYVHEDERDNYIQLVFEIDSPDPYFYLDNEDVLINCIPVVNVEKDSVSLSKEKPIAKAAAERDYESKQNQNGVIRQKQFLNLLHPDDDQYNIENIIIRRFGAERYNKNELLLQLDAILNRYVSDYAAFRDFDDLKDGNKMQKLNIALKDIMEAIIDDDDPTFGCYLMLNLDNTLTLPTQSIKIDYLLTDGQQANGIENPKTINTSVIFDKKKTSLLLETAGGKDEMLNKEQKKQLSRYAVLTKDRLYTQADLKSFCIKELLYRYNLNQQDIKRIDVRKETSTHSNSKKRIILIEISLVEGFELGIDLNIIENVLEKMIKARSLSILPVEVKIIL